MSGTQAINTLIDAKVVKNIIDGEKYILSLGEPLLTQPKHFYDDTIAKQMKSPIKSTFIKILTAYQKMVNKIVPEKNINAAADALYNIEYSLASQMRNSDDRNDPTKMEKKYKISDLKTNFNFLAWDAYFGKLSEAADETIKQKFVDNFEVSVVADDKISGLFALIKDTTKIRTDDLANYFNFRVIWDLRQNF